MEDKYSVELLKDSKYQVLRWTLIGSITTGKWESKVVFQGTIVECNSYIQLKEKGQL